jgi:hypothetical protein
MNEERDSEIEAVLGAYDHQNEQLRDEVRVEDDAGSWFDAEFRQVIDVLVRPYFEKIARQLEAHGHPAVVNEGSVCSPDYRLAGGAKITLAFLPKDRAHQGLHHQLELNDAPHLMLRCDKRKRTIELYQDPDPGWVGGPISQATWSIADLTLDNLRQRVLLMLREVLRRPSDRGDALAPMA